MSSRFSDEQTRQQFVIGITEILSSIFEVTEDEKKKAIYDELSSLSDDRLIDKKDVIEAYFDSSHELALAHMNKLMELEHRYLEEDEKSKIISSIQ
jgi:hypothetical protein